MNTYPALPVSAGCEVGGICQLPNRRIEAGFPFPIRLRAHPFLPIFRRPRPECYYAA